MIALKAQKLSLVLASIALQIVVLGLAGPEIDLPLSKVPLPTVVAWCLPAALTVGLCVESHLEGWNWFNPVRVGGLQSLCAATAALASLGLYRIFVASWPSEHVIALWWAFAAIGLVSRFFVGEGAWGTAAGVGDSRSVVPSGATGEDVLHAQAPPQGVPRGRRARGSQP